MTQKSAKPLSAIAIRHVPFEDLGSFASVLQKRGIKLSYRDAGVDDLSAIGATKPDLLVVLGGPIGAYEEEVYPFLRDELRLIGQRLAADLPTLGICLGAQLMARALGARVYPGPRKEIGWSPLTLTPEGARSCLRYVAPEKTKVLHWHGDTFDLPEDTVRLASTEICANQAFALGKNILALQFHAEPLAKNLERWLIANTGEIAATPGITVPSLRADTAREAPSLEILGPKCFAAWLDGADLHARVLDSAGLHARASESAGLHGIKSGALDKTRPRAHLNRKKKKNKTKKSKAKTR